MPESANALQANAAIIEMVRLSLQVHRSSHGRGLHPDLPATAQPFIESSRGLELPANKATREEPVPTKRSRKTSKRPLADPHKGDQGNIKRDESVVERIVRKLRGAVGTRRPDYQTSHSDYAKMLEPDYCKARLLEIGVGRRFWQSNPSPENAHTFYERVVQPLRRLQRQGVVETLQEITATDDRTPVAVEIIGQVDLTKVSKQ